MPRVESAVAEALKTGGAVVALESTIVTHGMPYPDNLETARAVEADVRKGGATPATIAVIDGDIRIGLDDESLEALARADDVMKLSRADLAVAIAQKRTGSATVAATMICARLAGITVFATGGIGGVHRGAEESFDISADLDELARTPVTVVCAGAKAILDIAKTLEVLETKGVPVIGYQTDEMPAFWSRQSGLPVPLRLDDPAAIAEAHRIRAALEIDGGQLVVSPIPIEAEIPAEELNPIIERAIREVAQAGIRGKAVTPEVLSRVLNLTGGRSLAANIGLVRNNACLAAQIAAAMAVHRP